MTKKQCDCGQCDKQTYNKPANILIECTVIIIAFLCLFCGGVIVTIFNLFGGK
jgi:hypothetical protein